MTHLVGVAYYARREDDLELLEYEIACDSLIVPASDEFEFAQESLPPLVPKEIGYYSIAFVTRITYYSVSTQDGEECDLNVNLVWHQVSVLDEQEQAALLEHVYHANKNVGYRK